MFTTLRTSSYCVGAMRHVAGGVFLYFESSPVFLYFSSADWTTMGSQGAQQGAPGLGKYSEESAENSSSV